MAAIAAFLEVVHDQTRNIVDTSSVQMLFPCERKFFIRFIHGDESILVSVCHQYEYDDTLDSLDERCYVERVYGRFDDFDTFHMIYEVELNEPFPREVIESCIDDNTQNELQEIVQNNQLYELVNFTGGRLELII